MRRAVVLAVVVAASGRAAAQGVTTEQQSDDLFGFDDKQAAPAADCSDGTGDACAFATSALAETESPFALTSVLTPARWHDLAVSDQAHDAIIPFALGANRDEFGAFFAGATGYENRWFVEGAATDSVEYGLPETRVPLLFIDRITVQAGGFSAADRAGTGGVVDVSLIRGGDHHTVAAEVWATAAGDPPELHPPTPFSFSVFSTKPANARSISAGVAATGPIATVAGAKLWYAAGIQPSLRDDSLIQHAQNFVDVDGDANYDEVSRGIRVTQDIDDRTFSELAYRVPILARVGAERGAQRLELTALITPFRDTQWAPEPNVAESAAGIRRKGLVFDGILGWRERWPNTTVRIVASWHRYQYDERPRQGSDSAIQLTTDFAPDDPALAAACDETPGSDRWPTIDQCPTQYITGGVGYLEGKTIDRPALVADVTQRFGKHAVSAGVSAEDGRVVTRDRITGGEVVSNGAGITFRTRYVVVGDGPDAVPCGDLVTNLSCVPVDEVATRLRTRQLAAYVNDEWRPRADYAFTGGVRWESMQLGDAFDFTDQISPRVGFAWDPLGGGTSRVFASFGRTYAVMPADIGHRYLPGPSYQFIDSFDDSGTTFTDFFDNRSIGNIDPGLAPMFTEELAGGLEIAFASALRFTGWTQLRWLRRGVEDVGPQDAFTLSNPVDATRRSAMLALELATTWSRKFGFRFQYQLGRSVGTDPGAIDASLPNNLYVGQLFDNGSDHANLYGPLPSDIRHRAAIEGTARFDLGPVPIVVGLRAVAATGRPVNVLGQDEVREEFFLLPRGVGGRLGLITTTNLHLSAVLPHGIELVADVFNLFDRQGVTRTDEVYTQGRVLPIVGGGREDLVFLRTADEVPVFRFREYGQPLSRQPPLTAAIGVRARF